MKINNIEQLEKRISELEKSLKIYFDIFHNAPVCVSLLDAKGFILDCNQANCEMFGYSREEMIGKHIVELINDSHKEFIRQKLLELKKTGVVKIELEIKKRDNSVIHVRNTINTILDNNGNIDKIIVQTSDITKRSNYEKNILRLATVVKQATQIIAITDLDGNIEYVNPAFENITGYSFQEVKGKNPRILKSDKHPSDFYKKMWDTLIRGDIWRGEITNKDKRGNYIYERAIIFPIKDSNNKIINYAKIAENITELMKTKDSLSKREEQLRTLINSTPDIICFKDGQGRWLEANEADLKLFQLDNIEYRGKTDRELAKYSEFYYDAFMTCGVSDETTWQKGEISRGVEIIPRPDGSENVYDVIKVPLFEPDGSRKGLVVIGRDITELIETGRALKDSEKKYREISELYQLMSDNMPDLIWAKDLDGKFIFVNKAVCEKLLGAKDTQEPLGKDEKFFVERHRKAHPERKDWYTFGETNIDSDQVVLKSKKAQRFDEYGNIYGKFLYLDVYKAPIFDDNGEIIGTIGHGRIVTKEKEIEKKLIASEKRYRRIFEDSQDVIFVNSLEGHFLDINPAGLKLFGYSSLEEIQKVDIAKDLYINPSDRSVYIEKIKKDGFLKDYELHLKKKDGSEVIVLETTTAIYDQDKGITILRGIMRDITEKRKLENKIAQTQKMETIGSLAGGIAHDFNNLLTVINGYTEMILSKMDTNNPFYNKIKSVQDAGERAANITNQLLAFSRKQIYKTEIVNINEIISSMDKMLRRLIGEDIHIEKILTGNLPNIKADKSQLEQIFINLMVNARDAIRNVDKPNYAKKIIIETGEEYLDSSYVEKHPDCNLGRHVFFAVSDNGSGIDKETMNKIFDPFFTTKEKGKGTGLGLSTVYGIVKQNNGSVNVYSEPGKGTMFKIYWPATAEKNSGNEKQIYDEIYYGNETILFVEDEDDVRRFTSESLTSLGYNVYIAENGYAALKLIKDQLPKIDLIITDLIMPKLNGKEFVLEAQKIYPGIKVIYISGYTDNHILHNGLLEKGVNFIHKPYSINKLASTVRKVLNNE